MNTLVKEDTKTVRTSSNPLGSYIDAKARGKIALAQHEAFFHSDAHLDRLDAVCGILKSFFGQAPSYITPRGVNRKRPFENVKMNEVGWFLNRFKAEEKNERLYAPLLALDNVEVISKNGHLTVRIF